MKLPPNHVVFQVSPEMTKLDVKNYLEKIYKVPVYNVMTRNVTGEVKKPGFLDPDFDITPLYKEDDIKYAYVTLVSFKFFNLRFSLTDFDFCSPKTQNLSSQISWKNQSRKRTSRKAQRTLKSKRSNSKRKVVLPLAEEVCPHFSDYNTKLTFRPNYVQFIDHLFILSDLSFQARIEDIFTFSISSIDV